MAMTVGPDRTATEAKVKWEDVDKLKILNSVALVLVQRRNKYSDRFYCCTGLT